MKDNWPIAIQLNAFPVYSFLHIFQLTTAHSPLYYISSAFTVILSEMIILNLHLAASSRKAIYIDISLFVIVDFYCG